MRYIYVVRGEGEARWAPRSGRTVWVSAGGPSASTAGCPAPSNSKRVAAKAKSCGDVGRWAAVRTCWTLDHGAHTDVCSPLTHIGSEECQTMVE